MEQLRKRKKLKTQAVIYSEPKMAKLRKPKEIGIDSLTRAKTRERTAMDTAERYGKTYEETTDDRNLVEKALNLGQGQGFFGDLFETLGRPMQAVQGALTSPDAIGGAFKGFTGKERFGGEKVAHSLGLINDRSPGWMKGLAGFGMDLVTDPLSYSDKPLRFIGKGIKKAGGFGLKTAKSVLMESERGKKIVNAITKGYERLQNITKSSLGIYKDAKYNELKGAHSNRINHAANVNNQLASILHENAREVEQYIGEVYKAKDDKVYKALGIEKEAPIEEVRKKMHDELSRAVEQNREQFVSEKDFLNRVTKPVGEKKEGRFLIAAKGEDAERQGEELLNHIEKIYQEQRGKPVPENSISLDNGFITINHDVRQTLNRYTSKMSNVESRVGLFGLAGKHEGAIRTLFDTGQLTLHLDDPIEERILEIIKREAGGKVQARITTGSGFASVHLSTAEIEKLMKSDDIREILEGSKEMQRINRELAAAERSQARTELVMETLKESTDATIIEHQNELQGILDEKEKMWDKRNKTVDNMQSKKDEISKFESEIKELNSRIKGQKQIVPFIKRGIDIRIEKLEKLLTNATNKVEKQMKQIWEMNKEMKNIDSKMDNILKKADKRMADLQGRTMNYQESIKDTQKLINRKQNTIDKIIENTDMEISKKTTNEALGKELLKAPTNKVVLEGNMEGQLYFQQLGEDIKRMIAYNDGNFYKVKFSESVLLRTESEFQKIINNLEALRVDFYETQKQIFGVDNQELSKLIDELAQPGYMRHVVNQDTITYNQIKKLESKGIQSQENRRKLISKLGDNAKFYQQEWLGSATDINERLGVEIFNTNPIEAQAVVFKILPDSFEANNLFQTAFDSGLIRNIEKEESEELLRVIKENMTNGMTANEAQHEAAKVVLPKEFQLVDAKTKRDLVSSFEFLKAGGAKESDLLALENKIQTIEDGDGMIMHRGMVNQLKRYGRNLANQDVSKVLKEMNKWFVQPFKATATLTTGFHVRNIMTNATNAYLAGVGITDYTRHFAKATKEITSFEKNILPKIKKVMSSGGENIRVYEKQREAIFKALTEQEIKTMNKMMEWQSKGVVGANRYSKDLNDILDGVHNVMKGKNKSSLMRGIKKVSDASMKFGKLSDDASKIAIYEFAKNTDKGKALLKSHQFKNPEELSKFVFFDYSDLTVFEEKIMKSIIPFYTWSRKNIEFQIRNFMRKPGRYIKLNKILKHWNDTISGGEDNMSKWDSSHLNIPVMNKDGKLTVMKVSPGFLDLEDTYKDPLNKLSPLIKAPLESMTGINLFTHKEINNNAFGQFGAEMFGDFGELGKLVTGQDVDSTKLGLIGNKINAAKGAIGSLVNGNPSLSSMFPSVFKQSDIRNNQKAAVEDRVRRSQEYMNQIIGKTNKEDRPISKKRKYRGKGQFKI